MNPRFKSFVIASLGFCTSLVSAQRNQAQSNVFILDTREGAMIRGLVLDGDAPYGPYLPLVGAGINVGADVTQSENGGSFEFKVVLDSLKTIEISAEGYATWTQEIGPEETGGVVDLGTITLRPDDVPVIRSLELEPDYFFLTGKGQQTTLRVTVNWLEFDPLRIELRENGRLLESISGNEEEAEFSLDLDALFPGGSVRAYTLEVVAFGEEDTGEVESLPSTTELVVFPWPSFLDPLKAKAVDEGDSIALDFSVATSEQVVTLPVVGRFGYEFGLGASFDYGLDDGSWEAAIGASSSGRQGKRGRRPKIPGFTRYPRPKLYIGNRELEMEVFAKAAGTAGPGSGIQVNEVSGGLSLKARLELARYGLLDLIGAGLTSRVRRVAGEDFVRNFSVRLDALPEISGQATFAPRWPLDFKEATVDLGLGLEAVYEPKVAGQSAKVYLGGKATGTFGLPAPIFRQVNFKGYAGFEVDAWVFSLGGEYVFLDYTYPGRRQPAGSFPIPGGTLLVGSENDETWQFRDRDWRERGDERFLLQPAGPGRRSGSDESEARAALDTFRRMGGSVTPGAIHHPAPTGPGRRLSSDPGLPAGVELPLLANVFPDSAPALAAQGDDLMLLYVRDTGANHPVNYTEIAWTHFDGTSWTTPQTMPPTVGDTSGGQFSPQVAFDGNGNAIAVFERVKDGSYAGSDLQEFGELMEIVWSQWNPVTQLWSSPMALTDNALLDFEPKLAGPMADGSLVLVWRESAGGELEASSASPQQLRSARWADGSWSPPTTLVTPNAGLMAFEVAAGGDKAVLVWGEDGDADFATDDDQEIFHRVFEGSSWSTRAPLTGNTYPDRNPSVCVDEAGVVSIVWDANGAMLFARDFTVEGNVRDSSDGLSVGDYVLTCGPSGNLVLVWQEMGEDGSDAHYRVYDPVSGTWSKDTRMSADSDVERDFSVVWDAVGNLTIAYNNTAIALGTQTVNTTGAGVIEVENVPQAGQVDLLVAKRSLVRDLAVVSESLKVSGTGFAPGEEVMVSAQIANTGNEAVSGLVVAFFNGDPDAGGVEIYRETLVGNLIASERRELAFSWTLPADSLARALFVVVDPDNAVAEFSEENNRASFAGSGPDLKLSLVETSVKRDGTATVRARVENIGTAPSSVMYLKLFEVGVTLIPKDSVLVSGLSPGESAELSLDHSFGPLVPISELWLEADHRELNDLVSPRDDADDVDWSNNRVNFTLSLWIDDDQDGVPVWWEESYGLSDSDAGDVLMDRDGDGFTDREEFLANTDPTDAGDFLRPGEFSTRTLGSGTSGTTVSFVWRGSSFALFDVERSFDLDGPWEKVARDLPGNDLIVEYQETLPPGRAKAFYRLIAK